MKLFLEVGRGGGGTCRYGGFYCVGFSRFPLDGYAVQVRVLLLTFAYRLVLCYQGGRGDDGGSQLSL